MNNSYSSINEEDLAEDHPFEPVRVHSDPHPDTPHYTVFGNRHHHADQAFNCDSGPVVPAITVSDDTTKSTPTYAMDSPPPPLTGGRQGVNRLKAVAHQAVAARRLSCKSDFMTPYYPFGWTRRERFNSRFFNIVFWVICIG